MYVSHRSGVEGISWLEFIPLTMDQLNIQCDEEPHIGDGGYSGSLNITARASTIVPYDVLEGVVHDERDRPNALSNTLHGFGMYSARRQEEDGVSLSVEARTNYDYRGCRNEEQRENRRKRLLEKAKANSKFSPETLKDRLLTQVNSRLQKLAEQHNAQASRRWVSSLSGPNFIKDHALAKAVELDLNTSRLKMELEWLEQQINDLNDRADRVRGLLNLGIVNGALAVISEHLFENGEPVVPEGWLDTLVEEYDRGRCLPRRGHTFGWLP